MKRFDVMGVSYAKTVLDVRATIETKASENVVALSCADLSSEIRYTTDGSAPSAKSELYESPISIKQSCTLKAQAFKNKRPSGSVYEQRFIIHKAMSAPVTLEVGPSGSYDPGIGALVDGIEGGPKFNDGRWHGFLGVDFNAVVDLGSTQEVNFVAFNFLHIPGDWIYAPNVVTVYVSGDGKTFVQAAQTQFVTDKSGIVKVKMDMQPVQQARYVKIVASNSAVVPAERQLKSWIFVDELIVE
jgi:hexosaminidase